MNTDSQLPRTSSNNSNAIQMIRRLLALLVICVLTCPMAANAGVESLLYLAGGELRSVGFDGTSFTSGFTSLTTPVPEMTGISYDPLDDILYYLAGGELRSVGFDGTSFTSGFTSLTTPVPEMFGISVIRTENVSTVAEPSTVLLFGGSLIGLFFANARRSRRAAIAA